MRNLKKILALVLALVMSLSLMATAGAKDFADKSDIDETGYQTAVDVLAELGIIRGYADGSFQPNGDITRAEVAAIVYRIATKDVADAQQSIYTSWGKFSDVKDGAWYAGYVNYCANAGIVKGTSATTFEPENKVTGYQVLAMILRTMGYGKNGEFEGGNWHIRTAATAKDIGILENIVNEELGSPATRAMVAEILFRAMLTEKVDYNTITGYQPNGTTLGQTQFGLEEIVGVITANEYADLEDDAPLSKGKTRLNVDGKDYTLNVTTDLTDIGERRAAYVRKSGNSFDLLIDELADNNFNAVAETGEGQSSIKTFAAKSDAALSITGAQHFENFGYTTVGESEWRLEYQVKFDNTKNSDKMTAQEWFEKKYEVSLTDAFYKEDGTLKNTRLYKHNGDTYTRVIPMGDPITTDDIAIMKGIFSTASDDNLGQWKVGVSGYVYAGTSKQDDPHDLSSEMTWRAFSDEYIYGKTDSEVKSTANGDWLKIIDNNGDGVAEYVFKTTYCMTQVLHKNSRQDYFNFGYHVVDEDSIANDKVVICIDGSKAKVNYINDDEVEEGDIVLAALIDGVWQIEKAPEEIKVIQTVSYRDDTVTTTEGDVYEQSGVKHHNDLDEKIMNMAEKVEYTIYFDHFGYVGAYTTEAAETNYGLLTELYYTRDRNSKYLTGEQMRVEIKMGEEDLAEKDVSNFGKNEAGFFSGYGFKTDVRGTWYDYLQRAVNHLGLHQTDVSTGIEGEPKPTDHQGKEFLYPDDPTETNVAIYTYDEDKDTVAIYPATQYAKNRNGEQLFYTPYTKTGALKQDKDNYVGTKADTDKLYGEKVTFDEYVDRYNLANLGVPGYKAYTKDLDASQPGAMPWSERMPVYTVDYVKLDVSKAIGANQVRYDMDEFDDSWNEYGLYDGKYDGNYVNATRETEYYVVNTAKGTVSYYVGYANLPEFNKGQVKAMYAVARNTTWAADEANYWVADVIVIEATGVHADWDGVALAYYNPYKSTGTTRHVDALSNITSDPQIDLVPADKNWNQTVGYAFYELYGTKVEEPNVTASSITEIKADFNAHKIYAGTVFRSNALLDYVMVDHQDGRGQVKRTLPENVPVYGIVDYSDGADKWELFTDLTVDDLRTGDQIIYVTNSSNTLKYIVVANFDGSRFGDDDCVNSTWTVPLWNKIINDQMPKVTGTAVNIGFHMAANEAPFTVTCEGKEYTVKDGTVELRVSNVNDFTFTVAKAKVQAVDTVNSDYSFQWWETDDPDVVTVRAYDPKYVKPLSAEEDAETKTVYVTTAYTTAGVEEIVKTVANAETDSETVNKLFKDLWVIKAGAIDGEDAKIGDAPMETAIKAAAVQAIVNTIVNASDDIELDYAAVVAMITEKVEAALDEAITAAGAGAVTVTIDKIAEDEDVQETVVTIEAAAEAGIELDKLDPDMKIGELEKEVEKAEEAKKVNVTLAASGAVITKLDAGSSAKVTPNNGDYTIAADAEVTVVMTITSETEIAVGTKVVLTSADADAAKIDAVVVAAADLSTDKKAVTVSVKIPAGATGTYTITLVAPTTGGTATPL